MQLNWQFLLWPWIGVVFFGFLFYSESHSFWFATEVQRSEFWRYLTLSLLWGFVTLFVARVIIVLFNRFFRYKTAKQPPNLLLDLVGFVIWVISLAIYLSAGLNIDLSAFSTPTSVTIAILGFALRALLMDLFSGIAMSIERPFDVGDWIKVEGYQTGRVTHTNWRVTKIVTLDQLEQVIPNNYLATKIFTNYNRPNALYRESVSITLGYDVTAHKAERVLLGAAKHVREVSEQPMKPDVRIGNFTPQGIEWKLRFWLKDYEKASGVTYQVQKAIARNLHFAGLEPPPEKHCVTMHEEERKMHESDISHILSSIEIFQPLMPAEIDYLAQVARRRLLLRGENAVIEKEQGNSLFIVAEGLMTVFITQADQQMIEVANIVSGKIFGEMSLLTGAPRAATVRAEVDSVVYEVEKSHLQTLLINRPDLVNKISQIISARQIENDQNLSKLKPQELSELQLSMAQRLKEKMSQFFKS